MTKVVIIGAGIGGLATANLLAAAGYDVSVYEKNAVPGGRAGQFKAGGFTFDTGPSWYLMPEVFDHYFALLGEKVSDHLSLERLDPAYKVYFEGQPETLTIHADVARDCQAFETIEKGAGRKLTQYLKQSEIIYELAIQNFLYTNFERKRTVLNPAALRALPRLVSQLLTPIDGYVSRFFKDQRLRQIMEYPMVFLGTSPYQAPALYSLMSHMDFKQGVYYPRGGMYGIIEAMVRIGKKHNVDYHYGADATRIVTASGHATAVEFADGTHVLADIAISNADLHFTETQLLEPADRTYDEPYWRKKQAGPSALLLYLGVRGELPELTHHNLLFTKHWRANFDAIFKHKQWPQPASMYVCKPSATDATVAPPGHENLFVLVPAPASTGITQEQLAALADMYLDQLSEMIGVPDLRERIVYQHIAGPRDFAANFNAWQGTALGLSHKLSQSALFRPANRSKKLDNLYYVGGNTVPGVGLPMCLIGAELVYKRLARDTSAIPLKHLRRIAT